MDARERFQRVMRYEAIDRPPVWGVEVVTEGAIRRWIQEGHFPIGMSLSDVFPLDPVETIYLDTEPLPNFVSRKVDEDERWWTAIDKFGFTVKMAEGGYIPAVDDAIMPDISFASYKTYLDLVRAYRL